MTFELKGGTSLSKGFQIIDRFSEDIDIRIEPPAGRDVKTGRNQIKPAHVQSRSDFYDWLAETIRIDGIVEVVRDRDFDNDTLLSGGIRLLYKSMDKPLEGLKDGILLEVGFDDVTPNLPKDISSWAVRLCGRQNRNHRQPGEGGGLLSSRIHVGGKAADPFDEISQATGNRGISGKFHASLL